ncbi:MAG: DUF1684 domain-containing protein [Flavobacteriales bacterium]|nr:DUF1684 domain-containing protein [Flavobacteriales bacterium]
MIRRILFLLISTLSLSAMGQSYAEMISAYRDSIDQRFADSSTSILTPETRQQFTGLDYFVPHDSFNIPAKFKRVRCGRTFKMQTSTDRLPIYKVYGVVRFELNDTIRQLTVYQSMDPRIREAYPDHLFCPFKDLTNGVETYGGGRYLDLSKKALKSNPTIDFNKAYNPYCAYNYKYSCPIPPVENHLKIRIEAGVKKIE